MDTVKADDVALPLDDAALAVLMDDPWPAGLRLVGEEVALPAMPEAVLMEMPAAAPVAGVTVSVPAVPAAVVEPVGERAVRPVPVALPPPPEKGPARAPVAEWAGMGLLLAGIGPAAADPAPAPAAAPAPLAAAAAVALGGALPEWPLLAALPGTVPAGEPGAAPAVAPVRAEAGAAPVAGRAVRGGDDPDPGFAPVAAPASAWTPGWTPAWAGLPGVAAAPMAEPEGAGAGDAEAAQAGEAAIQGVIEVDGAALGRFVAEHLAREAGRPPSGMTGFDPGLTPPWGGALQG